MNHINPFKIFFFDADTIKVTSLERPCKTEYCLEYFLREVWPSPQQDFRKIDFIAYITH